MTWKNLKQSGASASSVFYWKLGTCNLSGSSEEFFILLWYSVHTKKPQTILINWGSNGKIDIIYIYSALPFVHCQYILASLLIKATSCSRTQKMDGLKFSKVASGFGCLFARILWARFSSVLIKHSSRWSL